MITRIPVGSEGYDIPHEFGVDAVSFKTPGNE
jgi:hypothetical protein